MFPDSQIVTKFACGHSKAMVIVKTLAKGFKGELLDRMGKSPFTISTDGSNDVNEKLFPLVVRTLDFSTGLVQSELLSLPFLLGAAIGENIYKLVKDELEAADIPWANCIALRCDSTDVMVGKQRECLVS